MNAPWAAQSQIDKYLLLASGTWFLVKQLSQYELFASSQSPETRNMIILE